MDIKRFMIGTLVGGITMWGVGYLIWDLAFADFFPANAGSATGVARDAQLVWAVALGTFSLAALVTLAVGSKARSSTIGTGFKIGATVGFLVWFGVDFILYGVNNVWNLTATVVDPLLELVRTGIGGAVIAAVLGKSATPGSQESAPSELP